MIISDFLIHPIAVADPPLRSSYGLHAPYALRTILELRTTDGLTGISETYGGDQQTATFESLRSRIVGMDPFALTNLWRDLTSEEATDERSQTWKVPGENPADRGRLGFCVFEQGAGPHGRPQTTQRDGRTEIALRVRNGVIGAGCHQKALQ